jgi:hypothetical protein
VGESVAGRGLALVVVVVVGVVGVVGAVVRKRRRKEWRRRCERSVRVPLVGAGSAGSPTPWSPAPTQDFGSAEEPQAVG